MENILQKKLTVPLILLAIVGVTGSTYALTHTGPTVASAQTAKTHSTVDVPENTADTPDNQTAETKDPTYTSSIKTNDTTEVNDTTEATTLSTLAKITSSQAKTAAEKSVNGTASSVTLENEIGNVVYAVIVGTKEVKVDAGNGTILQTEAIDTLDSGTTSE